MFEFLNDFGNYDERKVDHTELEGGAQIDTARVSDGRQPFETAVSHPDYNDDKWVIVEAYDTKEDAQKGHDRWVKTMGTDPLPTELKDCSNANISGFVEALGGDMVFPRKAQV